MNRSILLILVLTPLWCGAMACAPANSANTTAVPSDMDPADLKVLVQGNNEFAFDLYRQFSQKTKGNLIFSPYSISSALAMTYAGARGETAAQMEKVLHFTAGQDRLHSAFGDLIANLQRDDKNRPFHLHAVNGLWAQKGFPFLSKFLKLTEKNYRARLQELDFARNPDKAREIINRWIEEQTVQKITQLLAKGDVDRRTRVVLTNAVYFQGNWKIPFPKVQTQEKPFEPKPGKKLLVPMMYSQCRFFPYYCGSEFALVELPYKGDRVSMVVLLPRQRHGLAQVLKKLTPSRLQQAIVSLKPRLGHVALPRFSFTWQANLTSELSQMGMGLSFSERANFSGMALSAISITRVVHKAFIDVDERGTEAAGATAIVGSALLGSSGLFYLTADHPFLFLIHDRQTGSILFLGRAVNPQVG